MITLFNAPVKRMLLVALVVLLGCKDADKNSSLIFEELNESLERSNKNLELSTIEAINSIESKRRDVVTAEKANVWFGRAYPVVENSNKIIDFIDSTQQEVIKMTMEDRKKYAENLDSMIRKYQQAVLTADSYERKEFSNRIIFHSLKSNILSDTFTIKTFLLKLKNDIRNMENMAVLFCRNQIGSLDGDALFEKFQPIAAMNSSVVKTGQEIIVDVGVGEFKLTSNPIFSINGINVLPNENGVGEYKMKIKKKPGKYVIPVKITYTKRNGQLDSLERGMEYIVVE